MNVEQERTRSYWMTTAKLERPVPLAAGGSFDVAVIGAGIAGLSAAYEFAKAGLSVVVLDRGAFGGGMTSRTTAHLTASLDDWYHELIAVRGEEAAAHWQRGQAAAIDRIEGIVEEEAIDCSFRRIDEYVALAEGDDPALIDRELEACHRIGFTTVEKVDRAPMPSAPLGPALRFPGQARFHPLHYLGGLVAALRREGARLHGDTPVTSVEEKDGRVRIETAAGVTLDAGWAVVATNSPVNDLVAIHGKQAPYRTYAMAFRVERGAVPDVLLSDSREDYHYVRLQEDGEGMVLIVGGGDHRPGAVHDHAGRFEEVEAWTRRHYPVAGEVVARWSGQVMEPSDDLPFSGRNPGNRNVFVHTGDSGQGITNGVMGAMLIADLVAGRENPLRPVCDPGRVPLRALRDLVSENMAVVKNLAGRLTHGERKSVEEVAPGEGALIRAGGELLAVYKDAAGTAHVHSGICTHAGCHVHWNELERCWDCPCHGSQFGVDGAVLNGPAISPLARREPPG